MQDSLRSISANAGIMQNWKSILRSVQAPVFNIQRELLRAMGPSALIGDSLRNAVEAIQGKRISFPTSVISDSLSQAVEAIKKQDESAKLALGDSVKQAMDNLRSPIDRSRYFGRTSDDLRPQIDSGFHHGDHLATMRSPSPDLIHLPEPPPFHETPLGRTAIAVEGLREAGERMEAAMDIIVGQAGEVSKLIGEVSGTIQGESRLFQAQSKIQTTKAVRYSRWSLGVAAGALVVSAVVSLAGYNADRTEALAQDDDAERMFLQMTQASANLAEVVNQQKQLIEAQRVQVEVQREQLDAQAKLLVELASKARTTRSGTP
jgi:hypothetical protein